MKATVSLDELCINTIRTLAQQIDRRALLELGHHADLVGHLHGVHVQMAKQIHTVQVPELAFGGHGLNDGTFQITAGRQNRQLPIADLARRLSDRAGRQNS